AAFTLQTSNVASSVDVGVRATLGTSSDQTLLTVSPQPSCQVTQVKRNFYDLDVLAHTGQNLQVGSTVLNIASIVANGQLIESGLGDGPSINRDGKVAFIARSPIQGTWSSNVIFTVDLAGNCKAINPGTASGVLAFGDALQMNDAGRIATSDHS